MVARVKIAPQENPQIEALQSEIARLNKVVAALIEQAGQQSEALEGQVRSRTRALEAALQRNEKTSRDLQLAHERMEQSEQRFRNIVEYAPTGMCIVDKELRYQLVNKAFCDMIGYSREELLSLTPFDITHPDDLASSRENLQKLIAGAIDAYHREKRYIRKDGAVVWVSLTTSLLRDAQGVPCGLIGQVQDVTARRLAEEKLRLAATVYDYSNEAMMITDADNRIIATNPAFTELTGYAADEVLGKNPRFLSSGRQGRDFYRALWQSLATAHHWEGDIWNRKKSGEFFAEWLSISVVFDDRGAVQNYVALFTDVTEKKKAAEQIWQHANYDALTRLPNRRLFRDRLEQGIKQADRSGDMLALLFIDLDRFKEVNDTLGHQVGDELLMQAAMRLAAQVRASDTVARVGGDEFTAILNEVADPEDVVRIAHALVDTLQQTFYVLGKEVHVSGSIGVALYPTDARTIGDLIKRADDAMYHSKKTGRNRYTNFRELHKPA